MSNKKVYGVDFNILENTFICASNKTNCTYDILMVGKELTSGCTEVVAELMKSRLVLNKSSSTQNLGWDENVVREPTD